MEPAVVHKHRENVTCKLYLHIIACTLVLSRAGFTGLSVAVPARLHRCPVTEQVANSVGLNKIAARPRVNFL